MTVREYIDKGLAQGAAGQLQKAALSFCQAVKLDSTMAESHQRLGEVLLALDYWDDAYACFCQAIKLNPAYAEAHNYLGVVLKHQNCLAEAEICYHKAIQLNPDYYEAYHNLGNCLKFAFRFAEAEAAYCKALQLKPDLLKSRFSLAILYLLLGQYDKGWNLYDSRLNWRDKFRLNIPIWQGEALTGRKILLFYEQGFGDMIQFIRYADQVAKFAEATTVWIQKPLRRLLINKQASFTLSDGRDIDPQQFDFACSLMSIPAKFTSSMAKIPRGTPYLRAAGDTSAKWHEKINKTAGNQQKVGIVWAGNSEHSDDHNRSIPFDLFSQLFTVPGLTWISLQVGRKPPEETDRTEQIVDFTDELIDFAETAGVIENLDLVIAVDTAVAHLAGALGKPTWLLLPYRSDWRWGLLSETSTWYQTMRLFRQEKLGDWQGLLEQVKTALQNFNKGEL
jgi:tetratricopeptide (TPR) repeat protein